MGRQPTDDREGLLATGQGCDPGGLEDRRVMRRVRKKPRGFYAGLARARGVSVNAVYRELNPDKRPCVREKHECDAREPWEPRELIRMDKAFCDAMRREIARGTERPRGTATEPGPPPARPPRRSSPRRSGASSIPQSRRDRRTRSVLLT